MFKNFFAILLIFTGCFSGFSQKKASYALKGIVQDSIEVLKNVNILNLRTKDGAFSNDFGGFEIRAAHGDSILFSSIQHFTLYHVVNKKNIEEKSLNVYLSSLRHKLDEIILERTDFIGFLEYDRRKNKEDSKTINATTLGLPNAQGKKLSQIDRKIYTASTSSSGVPLDLIINILSGRLKKLKEEKTIVAQNNDVEVMLEKLKHFLTSEFNIKKEDHYRFLFYCRTDSLYDRSILNNELDLINYLQERSRQFNELSKENRKEKKNTSGDN